VSRFDPSPPVSVPVGECQCPGTPHPDGDLVLLRPRLSWDGGVAASKAVQEYLSGGATDDTILSIGVGRAFLRHGIVGWNFVDESGPVPVDEPHLTMFLGDWDSVRHVAEKADELYGETLTAPLVAAASASSRNGQTASSTPPTPGGSSKPRRRSR
jgi:hypothetical protein